MTASPTEGDAPDVPAVPAEAGLPAPADGSDGSGDKKRRRRRKLVLLLLLLLGLAILIGLAIWYLLFREPLPPIPGLPESQVPSYSTSIYGAARPVGVAVTEDGGRIYVSESAGDRVVKIFDAGGTLIGQMVPGATPLPSPGASGGAQASPEVSPSATPDLTAGMRAPLYVAIDPLTQQVYVSDRLKGTIFVYDAAGAFQREFVPTPARPSWQPAGITFSTDGNLHVTDMATGSVVEFDRQGLVVREFGQGEVMSFPNGVALDQAGNAYVTDSNNGRLLAFDANGQVIARVGRGADAGKLGLPRGIAIDEAQRMFVVDTTGQGVGVYRTFQGSPTLENLGFFGAQGASDGQFNYPNGIAVDGRGRVYVTDSGNDRVQIWSY